MKKSVLFIALLFVSVSFAQSITFSKDITPAQDITFKNGLYLHNDIAYTG